MTAEVRSELVDALVDAYVEWREECLALAQAYQRWSSGSAADRDLAFAAYRAALDREQQASSIYADRSRRVERELAARPGFLRRLWRARHIGTEGRPVRA